MRDEISTYWYSITNWEREAIETEDKTIARQALREGSEVIKTTRRVFQSGPSSVYLTVTTKIEKTKDL